MDWLVKNASVVIASASAIAAFVSWMYARNERKLAQQTDAYRAVSDYYAKIIELKLGEPRYLVCARDWNPKRMQSIYKLEGDSDELWARYYTYVEVCIGCVNAILQAHDRKLMGDGEFEKQWEPLARLIVAEHYPIIASFSREVKKDEDQYLSAYLRGYLAKRAPEEWQKKHDALVWPDA